MLGMTKTADDPSPAGFVGDFETHVTVACSDSAMPRLESWSASARVKLTHVVLARGRVWSQPMLTFTGSGTLASQLAASRRLVSSLAGAGFVAVRVKVEAAPWSQGVPRTIGDALALGADYYFEHHVKLLLEPHAELDALAELVIPHGAHLSWNARKLRSDGRVERFVTQRCTLVDDERAAAALQSLIECLRVDGREVASTEREFVVYDSDASLDAGWIDTSGRVANS